MITMDSKFTKLLIIVTLYKVKFPINLLLIFIMIFLCISAVCFCVDFSKFLNLRFAEKSNSRP